MNQFAKYVRFADVEDYLKIGWLPFEKPLHYPHGDYSIGMIWVCDCKCVCAKGENKNAVH